MNRSPFVSILIPCYNAERWVRQAIQSCLDQTYPHKEVIVVDDGSTDGSLTVIKSFGDAIRMETGPNRGGNAARNRLLALSRGEWTQYLDADDYLLPDKIERQMLCVAAHPEVDVVYSPLILRTEATGQEVTTTIPCADDPIANYLSWSGFSTISILLRRATLETLGRWNESQQVCQEHEMISRLIVGGARFELCQHAGAIYRFHHASTISTRSRENTFRQRMLLTDRMAKYLQETGQLTETRRAALARSRFETARWMYFKDRKYARSLMQLARSGAPLPPSPAMPASYRLALSLFGFDIAERIAQAKRALVKTGSASSNASH
jgi:glycosyltransferase involved in cell wall biosynthesis